MNKHILLSYNFMVKYSILRYLIPVTLFFIGVNVYLQVILLDDPAKLLEIISRHGDISERTRVLKYQLLKTFVVLLLVCALPSLTDYYLTKLYRICVGYHVTKALNIEHMAYHEKGSGRIMSIIERKAHNYVLGIDILLHKIISGFCFVLFTAYSIYFFFDHKVLLNTLLNCSVTLIVNWPLIGLKKWYRAKYIEKYNTLKVQILSIIMNYDIIKANNKEDEETENLDGILEKCATTRIEGAWLRFSSSFVTKAITIFLNGLFFYMVLKKVHFTVISSAAGFVRYNSLFVMMKGKVGDLRIAVLTFINFLSDIQTEDWDDFKSDIENLECYYNYEKIDKNSDIQFVDIEKTVLCKNKEELCAAISSDIVKKTPDNVKNFENSDFTIIKNTILQTYKPINSNKDGTSKFLYSKCLEFKDFSLSVKNRLLINPSNFKIFRGEKVGIVGKNGSGKSTFMNVLLRYRDYSGELYVDDIEMKTINKISQRENIAYVPQTPGILGGTILDNIVYCNQNEDVSEVEKICKKYEIEFEDLNKDVGENGKFISGGQKQKIGFLRGVLKNSDILLLDEPTASMDPCSEQNIINKIHTQMNKKTVIAIIHKPNLLRKFDKFLVFYNQEIIVYTNYQDFEKDSYLYYQ